MKLLLNMIHWRTVSGDSTVQNGSANEVVRTSAGLPPPSRAARQLIAPLVGRILEIMPISVACGDCGKRYSIKDELAGKKFRCKGCEAIVEVPSADEPDDEYEDADGDAEDYDDAPPRRRKSVRASRPRRRPRGESMPVSAILATCCQCVLFGMCSLGLLAKLINSPDGMAANETGNILGMLLRVAIAGAVLMGMLKRSENARLWSRRLSGIGIVFGVIIMAGCAVALASIPAPAVRIGALILLGVMILQTSLWTTLVVCLNTDSAEEWYNK